MKAMKAKSKLFQKKLLTKWEPFLTEVNHFLTDVGPGNVIEIIRIPSGTGYQFLFGIGQINRQPMIRSSLKSKER